MLDGGKDPKELARRLRDKFFPGMQINLAASLNVVRQTRPYKQNPTIRVCDMSTGLEIGGDCTLKCMARSSNNKILASAAS